ncbi:unnamed protein product [Ostreobium quekettii]|uniref:Cation/H+ exchanger transmembrane domain-containing protein n=1 Tax=Ostreobium quekettii TaxID=121088 RepID=A0A8S1IP00_9CHLO|nr:unnamed protein product [Ostreobium quekettii]
MAEAGGEGLSSAVVNELEFLQCEEEDGAADVVLFTFFMLFIGLFTRHVLAKVPVPYTGLLLLAGLVLGLAGSIVETNAREKEEKRLEREALEALEGSNSTVAPEEVDVEEAGGEVRVEVEYELPKAYEHLGRGMEAWTNISPELLLLVHLPALIFASGFSMDFHIFKRNFWQILLLAGPGVAIGTGFTAVVGKFIFPYGWCWPKALMFGAMLSATDPVAVVALLKEVGASETLGTVIEGESLLNDGTAFVFFLVFRDLIRWTTSCNTGECHGADRMREGLQHLCKCRHPEFERLHEDDRADCEGVPTFEEDPDFKQPFTPVCSFPHRTFGETLVFFLRMAIGAPALGAAFGFAASMWINYVYNDLVVEVAITIVTAYLTYFTADDLVGVSGVLATVALGITMAVMARPRLSPKAHEPMEVFWELMEYFANSTIFIYAGVEIAKKIYEVEIDVDSGDIEAGFINKGDWGLSILLYLFLQLIRLLTIIMLYPFIMLSGYAVSWKDVLVMTWGGLRGAVGLALALIVDLDEERIDPKFRALTIFYMGLIAAYTLLVNGTSMSRFLDYLGVTKTKPEKLEVLLHVVKSIENIGSHELSEAEPDHLLGDPDWNLVLRITSLDVSSIIPSDREIISVMMDAKQRNNPVALELQNHLNQNSLAYGTTPRLGRLSVARYLGGPKPAAPAVDKVTMVSDIAGMSSVVTKDMLVMDFRTRLLTGIKSVYGELIEEGEISAEHFAYLKESADEGLDSVSEPLSDWYYLENSLSASWWRRVVNMLLRGFEKTLQRMLFTSLETSAIIARNFIHAHEEATHSLHEYIQFIKQEQAENGVQDDATRLVEEASAMVLEESRQESEQAVEFVKNLRRAYPEVARAIKSKLAAWEILRMKQEYVQKLGGSGLIEAKEATALELLIEATIKKLMHNPPRVELAEPKVMLKTHPVFYEMDHHIFETTVWPHAKLKVYDKDQGAGKAFLYLCIGGFCFLEKFWLVCANGTARSALHESHLREGAMVGISEVMLRQRRSRSFTAETVVQVYHIDAVEFLNLARIHESVRRRAWQMAGAFQTLQHPWGAFKGASLSELQSVFWRSELLTHMPGDRLKVDGNWYLASGEMVEINNDGGRQRPIPAPAPLSPSGAMHLCTTDVKILKVPENARPSRLGMKSSNPSVGPRSSAGIRRTSLANLSMRPSQLTANSISKVSGGSMQSVQSPAKPRSPAPAQPQPRGPSPMPRGLPGIAEAQPAVARGGLGGIPEGNDTGRSRGTHDGGSAERAALKRPERPAPEREPPRMSRAQSPRETGPEGPAGTSSGSRFAAVDRDPGTGSRFNQSVMTADSKFRREMQRLQPQTMRPTSGEGMGCSFFVWVGGGGGKRCNKQKVGTTWVVVGNAL